MASHPSHKSRIMDYDLEMPPPTYHQVMLSGLVLEDIPLQDFGPNMAPTQAAAARAPRTARITRIGQAILRMVPGRARTWRLYLCMIALAGFSLTLVSTVVLASSLLGPRSSPAAITTAGTTGSIVNTSAATVSASEPSTGMPLSSTVPGTTTIDLATASRQLASSLFVSSTVPPRLSATSQSVQTGSMQSATLETSTIRASVVSPTTSAPDSSDTDAIICPPGLDLHCGI